MWLLVTGQVYFFYLQVMAGKSTAVCVSDGCLLPLLLAKAAGVQLYSIESSSHSSSIVKEVGPHENYTQPHSSLALSSPLVLCPSPTPPA